MNDLRDFNDDPVVKAMNILANAGYYSVRIAATSPSSVRVIMDGGAPKPKKARKVKP